MSGARSQAAASARGAKIPAPSPDLSGSPQGTPRGTTAEGGAGTRRRTLLPLDDVLGCLREAIPALTRSSLEPIAFPGSHDQVEGPGVFGCTPPYLPLASRPDVVVFQTCLLYTSDAADE